jgi:hypothetical protein
MRYICMVDRQLLVHLVLLAAILLGTLMLIFWPQAILQASYRCELQTLFGIHCPFCGMTRDFADILRGARPTLNPCSWFAACVLWVLYPAAVVVAWRCNRLALFHSTAAHYFVVVVLGIMLVANNWR